MSEFRFAYPLFLLLLALPVAYVVWRLRQRRKTTAALQYSDTRLMRNLPVGWQVRLRLIPDALRIVVWILLVIVLARPQAGNARQVLQGQGVDIVLALDISNTMNALDFAPQNRLEAAKSVIADFIAGRDFDRIGLVVFARNAYHQAPLTLDYDVLLSLLDEVQLARAIGVPDGTAVGLGIASSANMLRSSDAASRVIILLTDGDNNAALDPLEAARAAEALGIRVYTIGMGLPGLVDVPGDDGEIITVESEFNPAFLREIAAIGSGRYFQAADLADLQQIYDQIDALERSYVELRVIVRWEDRVGGLLAVVIVVLLVERLLRRTVFEGGP